MTEQADQIRVLCVDDHPAMREGIAAYVSKAGDMQVVAEAVTGQEAIEQYRTFEPDVTLMDLRLPDISGLDALLAIRKEFGEARIIMLTTFDGDADIRRSLESGAQAYLLKTMPRARDTGNHP